jgi:hypothetical protein
MVGDDSDEDHIAETYAHFRLAAYMANVVELGLVQMLMQIEFMTPVRQEYMRTQGKHFDRQKFESDFETFMAIHFSKTMGALALRVANWSGFDDELKGRISAATRRRHFLAQRYWRERLVLFSTKDGRTKMMEELSNDADVFEQLDKDIREATKPIREALGIADDALDAGVERRLSELRSALKPK